jgi:predicted transposase/invertase (TIGR01784 family)
MTESIFKPKPVDELTFTDDGMFQEVLRNPDICAELVERLLHVRVNRIEYPELEKTIAPYYTTKGVRLDVYLKDTDKIIDVEMQSYPQDALGKRTRYYQSMIDMDSLMKGQDYSELKDSYILFICKKDPFKNENKNHYGLPCYTFKNICEENHEVNLNDKSMKVIYNASAYDEEKDANVKAFLHFIHTNEPGEDDFTNRLSTLVEQIKDNEKFRRDYAAMNLHDRDITRAAKREGLMQGIAQGLSQGIVQGASEAKIEAAITLVRKYNVAPESAAKDMNAPLDKVLESLANTHL